MQHTAPVSPSLNITSSVTSTTNNPTCCRATPLHASCGACMNNAPVLSSLRTLADEICINSSFPFGCQPGRADPLVKAPDKLDLSQTDEVSLSEAIQPQDDIQPEASKHPHVRQHSARLQDLVSGVSVSYHACDHCVCIYISLCRWHIVALLAVMCLSKDDCSKQVTSACKSQQQQHSTKLLSFHTHVLHLDVPINAQAQGCTIRHIFCCPCHVYHEQVFHCRQQCPDAVAASCCRLRRPLGCNGLYAACWAVCC